MNGKQRQPKLRGFDESDGSESKEAACETEVPQGGRADLTPKPADKSMISESTGPAPPTPELGGESVSLDGQTVYVIDSHALIYQVFHALPDMTGPSGQPAGAIHGFVRDMVDLLKRKAPDFLICAFDAPGKTFRHGLFEEYKLNRSEMPLDLQLQIPNIQRFLEAMRIPVLSCEGYEADDILATAAARVDALGGKCFLVTCDKDCRQLIRDRVKLFNIRKDEIVDEQLVMDEWGIRPDQVIDFQALWGDATDNIPGVAGIGKKTAGQLLAEFDTLERIYEHVEELSGAKKRENVRNGYESAMLSRQLVRLTDEVPVKFDWNAARVSGADVPKLRALCDEFGFRRLADQLSGMVAEPGPVGWTAEYETIDTREKLVDLVRQLSDQTRISIDTETTSTRPRWAEIVGYSFSWKPGHAVYVPVRAPVGDPQLDPAGTLEALRPVLEDPAIEKVGQNIKYDMIVLRHAGVRMQGIAFDTMVADYLLSPGQRGHSIDDLARRYLQHETIKIRELIGSGKNQIRMDEVPVGLVTPYAGEDALVPWQLATELTDQLKAEKLDELYFSLELPLVDSLAEMEFNGVSVDVGRLGRLGAATGRRMEELEFEIYQMAGCEFNIDSPKQLAKVLFDDLKLPVVKRTKTGASTDASVLSQLAEQHELPAKIIEYRQFAKLKNTYMDALPKLVHPQTQRIHTSFKQDVAATGRLSSTDPNLQNIPVRTPEGREIRAAFVPGAPGWQLLCADYSQIELRVLAHCSQDEAMLQAFENGHDIHAQVAGEVHGVPLDQVTSDMRRSAKAINFGVIYGQSPFGLAKALGISQNEAATFIDAYFDRYPGVEDFMRETLERCRVDGHVETIWGRRRPVHGIRDTATREKSRQRNLPERIAVNTVIQGSAADLIKRAMIDVHRRLETEKFTAKMLLQIHDELVFEAAEDELQRLAKMVVEAMASVGDLCVSLKVDVKVGLNWADCEPLDVV